MIVLTKEVVSLNCFLRQGFILSISIWFIITITITITVTIKSLAKENLLKK